jgi:hypothetical protein
LDVSQAAVRCGVSISFLNKLRTTGGGPPYSKLGRAVRYLDSKLDAWIAAQERRSTSEQPPKPVAPSRRRKAGKTKPQLEQVAELHHAPPK